MTSKIKVGVIFGGLSTENEVSLSSGRYVCMNLNPAKYDCIPIYFDAKAQFWQVPQKLVVKNTTADIEARLEADAKLISYEGIKNTIDFAFNVLHGKYGEDGCIQGLFELLKIPYSCSGVLASAVGMDKGIQSHLLRQGGCNVPEKIIISKKEWENTSNLTIEHIKQKINFPAVIKPSREGSSIGVSVVNSEIELNNAIDEAFNYDTRIICEKFLNGMEFSCLILGNDYNNLLVMPPTETFHESPFFTYKDKYMPGRSQKITPARVSDTMLKKIKDEVQKAYAVLKFQVWSRIDGFVVKDKVYIIDPNTLPGMAPASFIFHQAAEVGLTPSGLIEKIIGFAIEAHQKKIGPL